MFSVKSLFRKCVLKHERSEHDDNMGKKLIIKKKKKKRLEKAVLSNCFYCYYAVNHGGNHVNQHSTMPPF